MFPVMLMLHEGKFETTHAAMFQQLTKLLIINERRLNAPFCIDREQEILKCALKV